MGIKGMSDFEQSILTDEERAALEADDAQEEGAADEQESPPAGDPDNPVTEMVDDPEEPAPAVAEPEEAVAEAQPADETPAEEAPAAETPAAERRRDSMTFVMPEGEQRDYAAERKVLDEGIAALAKRFDDGEITSAEYAREQMVATAKLVEISKAEAKAELAREINDAQWQRDVRRFLRDHDTYAQSPVLYAALNEALGVVGRDPANASLDGDELLEAAHKEVMRVFGQVPTPSKGKAPTRPLPKPGEAEAKAIKAAPKTLAEVPAADDAQVGGDKWAYIDRLSGMAYEQALAKLSADEIEAYSAARS